MNLILDIGNTLAKVALIENKEIVLLQSYKDLTLADIQLLISGYSPKKAIISIVGTLNADIQNYIRARIKTIILDCDTKIPIANQYSTPQTLGYDRIAVAVGANSLYPQSHVLVIDAGTAITYEMITATGVYAGGAISPGISLRFRALNSHTAKLPYLEKTDNYPLIGRTTNDCIYSGVLNGITSEVDGYIDKVKTNYPDIKVVLTGGDSNFFVNKLKNIIFVNQNLMAIGLNRILEFNSK